MRQRLCGFPPGDAGIGLCAADLDQLDVCGMRRLTDVLIDGDSLANEYGGLDAMPTSVYVDKEGKVVAMQLGISSKDDMEAHIRKAMGEGQ